MAHHQPIPESRHFGLRAVHQFDRLVDPAVVPAIQQLRVNHLLVHYLFVLGAAEIPQVDTRYAEFVQDRLLVVTPFERNDVSIFSPAAFIDPEHSVSDQSVVKHHFARLRSERQSRYVPRLVVYGVPSVRPATTQVARSQVEAERLGQKVAHFRVDSNVPDLPYQELRFGLAVEPLLDTEAVEV